MKDQGQLSTLQIRISQASRPVITDVRADGYLLVIGVDALVFLLKMAKQYNRTPVDVKGVYTSLMFLREAGLVYKQNLRAKSSDDANCDTKNQSRPAPGGGITEAMSFPPLTHAKCSDQAEVPISTHIMLLRSTGSLMRLNTEVMV